MINSRLFAIRNPLIIQERIQPVYSQFILRYDSIDFPIYVNDSAAEILRLCDGRKSIMEIYKNLSEKYKEPIVDLENKLNDFWDMSIKCKYIYFSETPMKEPLMLEQTGSCEYWTPDLISVELTHICPLKCKHCFLSAGKGNTMQKSTWDAIFNSVIEMKISQVQLTGGEPLLHPSFFDFLNLLLNNNVTVHIFTSGVIFSEDIFKKIKEYAEKYPKKILFQVSIDGLSDYHDRFRGVIGSFERTIYFVKKIVEMGLRTSVGVTVSEQSFCELKSLCELCRDIGVSIVRVGGITNRGRAEKNGLGSKEDEIANIIDVKNKIAAELNSDTFKVLLNEESNDDSLNYLMNCGLGQTSIKIDPIGNVYPCMMAEVKYADINKNSLLEIQKKYSRIFEKIKHPTSFTCQNCKDRMICEKCIVEGYAHSIKHKCTWVNENLDTLKQCFWGN